MTATDDLIRPLSGLRAADAVRFGGKAANLGELIGAGIPVPPGFALSVQAWHEARLHGTPVTMPSATRKALYNAFDTLGAEYVAARSSAPREDGTEQNWAGQFESVLGLSREGLVEAVEKVWNSPFSARAREYALAHDLSEPGGIGVVIQALVESDFSGVAFTTDPVTGDVRTLVIEAVSGFGDALVSGHVTPDTFYLRKSTCAVTRVHRGNQDRQLIRSANGMTWSKTNIGTVPERVLSEVAHAACRIETHYSHAVDVEWAHANGVLFIVQARPVTPTRARHSAQPSDAVFELSIRRDFSMPMLEIWNRVESAVPIPFVGATAPGRPHIIFERRDGTTASFYNAESLQSVIDSITSHFRNNRADIGLLAQEVSERFAPMRDLLEHPRPLARDALLQFIRAFEAHVPYAVVMWTLCSIAEKERDLDLLPLASVRVATAKLSSGADQVVRQTLAHIYPQFGSLAAFMTCDEVRMAQTVSASVLERRHAGFIWAEGLFYGGRSELASRQHIVLPHRQPAMGDTVVGICAMHGVVQGRARRIMGHDDIDSMQLGEILISPMAMPDLLPAIRRALAIVTDEGGLTSHAAIIAREFGIPCVVGTGTATEVIDTGDLITVDANTGTVQVIERGS